MPLKLGAEPPQRALRYLFMIGRLREHRTIADAAAQLATIAARLEETDPQANYGLQFTVLSLRDQVLGGTRAALAIVGIAAMLVLGIACVNTTNLLLVSTLGRAQEFAVRLAIGASPWHLCRQLLVEALLLSIPAAAGGLVVARLIAGQLASASVTIPRLSEVAINRPTLIFAVVLSIAVGFVVTLIPVFNARGIDPKRVLHGTSLAGSHPAATRWRRAFVMTQVALAVTVVGVAGLLVRGVLRLERIDPGFRARDVVALEILLPETAYGRASDRMRFQRDVLARLQGLPTVRHAATVDHLPFGESSAIYNITIENRIHDPGLRPRAVFRTVSPDYFKVLSMAVRAGRPFSDADGPQAPPVIIVNEEFVRLHWPGEGPIGKRLKRGQPQSKNPWMTVVGVVQSTRSSGLTIDPAPEVFIPYSQRSDHTSVALVLSLRSEPTDAIPMIRQAVRAVDDRLPVSNIDRMEHLVAASIGRPRLYTQLVATFAAVALVLAVIGVGGINSLSASSRVSEITLRICLGAQPEGLLRLLVRQSLVVVLLGVAAGLGGALLLGRGLATSIPGVDGADWLGLGAGCGAMLLTGAIASYLPVRHVLHVNPAAA